MYTCLLQVKGCDQNTPSLLLANIQNGDHSHCKSRGKLRICFRLNKQTLGK